MFFIYCFECRRTFSKDHRICFTWASPSERKNNIVYLQWFWQRIWFWVSNTCLHTVLVSIALIFLIGSGDIGAIFMTNPLNQIEIWFWRNFLIYLLGSRLKFSGKINNKDKGIRQVTHIFFVGWNTEKISTYLNTFQTVVPSDVYLIDFQLKPLERGSMLGVHW